VWFLVGVWAVVVLLVSTPVWAGLPWKKGKPQPPCEAPGEGFDGSWWPGGPEEEQRVVRRLYSRSCVRCHAVDGRGSWDIPNVPDFSSARWHTYRSDDQLARVILEGWGAWMPAFRGAVTLDEAFALARHLRTFIRSPDSDQPETPVRNGPASSLQTR
jgi:hypothetical protein